MSVPGTLSDTSPLPLVMGISGTLEEIIMIHRVFKAAAKPHDGCYKNDAGQNFQLYGNRVTE